MVPGDIESLTASIFGLTDQPEGRGTEGGLNSFPRKLDLNPQLVFEQ